MRKLLLAASAAVLFTALPAFAQQLPAICSVQSNLSQGMQNGNVTILQQFLGGQGYFNTTATGYFGPITEASLIAFQNQTGITAQAGGDGLFGSFTRSYIAQHFCSGSSSNLETNVEAPTPIIQNNTVSPVVTAPAGITPVATTSGTPSGTLQSFTTAGTAPYTANFYISCVNAQSYDITFGDNTDLGGSGVAETACNGKLQTVSHIYQNAGTDTAELVLFVQQSNGTFSTLNASSVVINVTASSTASTTTPTASTTPSATINQSSLTASTTSTVVLSGTAANVSTLTVVLTQNGTGTSTFTVPVAGGVWSVTAGAMFPAGNYPITVSANGTQLAVGTLVVVNPVVVIATPSSGALPLVVTFTATGTPGATLSFGDGSSTVMSARTDCSGSACASSPNLLATHTYLKTGTYFAVFNDPVNNVSGTTTVTVSAAVSWLPENSEDEAEMLYLAYFGVPGDSAGLQNWTAQLSNNLASNTGIASLFAGTPTAQQLYPFLADPTPAGEGAYVTEIYKVLFNRAPDSTGYPYWIAYLDKNINNAQIVDQLPMTIAYAAIGSDVTTLNNEIHSAEANPSPSSPL